MKLTVEVRAHPGKNNELYQTLRALLSTMRKEKGCLHCSVAPEKEDGDVYVLSCDWDGQASLESYMKSGSGSALLGAIDLLGESTRIRVGRDEKWKGIDALRRIRKAG